jgi:ribosome maturation protein SDO1
MSGRAMKTQLALPTGIKKLTNIAVVRLKKHGVRFEIACYKNTAGAWRDGFEKDIDNVLQTTQIYNNVSKGVFAKEEDLLKAFGSADEKVVARLILETGEVQVSDKERKNTFDNIFRDAVNVLVDKCVNPETNRPYPPGMIERALREVHFQVDPTKSAKQQALAALPRLQKVFPIKRAEMRFRLTVPTLDLASATQDMLANENATIEKQAECEIVCTADPSVYRSLDKFAKETSVQLEVVTMAVMEGGVSETFHEMESTRGGAASASGAGDGDGAYAMRDMDGALAGAVPGGDGEAKMAKAAAAPRVRRAGGDDDWRRRRRGGGGARRGLLPSWSHRGDARGARVAAGPVRVHRRDPGWVVGRASSARRVERG